MNASDIHEKQNEYVAKMRSLQQKYQRQWRAHAFAHNILHIIIFVGAVVVPFLLQLKVDTTITIIVSAMVAVAAALTQFFQFADRRRIYRLTAEGLRTEFDSFEVCAGEYRNLNAEEAFEYFLEQTQNLRYQNVEEFFKIAQSEPKQGS